MKRKRDNELQLEAWRGMPTMKRFLAGKLLLWRRYPEIDTPNVVPEARYVRTRAGGRVLRSNPKAGH